MNNEYFKFARMLHGISSTALSRYESAVDAYSNPSIIEGRNFWMTAQEALEYGMVDQILTKK